MARVTVEVADAWVIRAQRAVAWSQGQTAPVSVDAVVAEMVSRLNAIVVQQEVSHGIDPATGEADPVRLVADLTAERIAKEAAEAEVMRLTAELEAKLTKPVAIIVQ